MKALVISLALHGLLATLLFAYIPNLFCPPQFKSGGQAVYLVEIGGEMEGCAPRVRWADAKNCAKMFCRPASIPPLPPEFEQEIQRTRREPRSLTAHPSISSEPKTTPPTPQDSSRAKPTPTTELPPSPASTPGVLTENSLTEAIYPVYPIGARLRGEEGTVIIKARVDSAGRVLEAAVSESSGFPALDKSAMRAVQKARFTNPSNSQQLAVLTFRFRLEG